MVTGELHLRALEPGNNANDPLLVELAAAQVSAPEASGSSEGFWLQDFWVYRN